jgi:hypothetical protein
VVSSIVGFVSRRWMRHQVGAKEGEGVSERESAHVAASARGCCYDDVHVRIARLGWPLDPDRSRAGLVYPWQGTDWGWKGYCGRLCFPGDDRPAVAWTIFACACIQRRDRLDDDVRYDKLFLDDGGSSRWGDILGRSNAIALHLWMVLQK